jgi:hypothetical protein
MAVSAFYSLKRHSRSLKEWSNQANQRVVNAKFHFVSSFERNEREGFALETHNPLISRMMMFDVREREDGE